MNYEVYHIPTNFTDAGRVMGLFELRNLVEAVLLTLPALYLCRDTIFAGTRQFFNREKTPRQKCRGGETIVLK